MIEFHLLFRSFMAMLISLGLSLLLAKPFVRYLVKQQIGQVVRELGPQSHFSKKGTPTMGGALIFITMTISVLCCGDWSNSYLWAVLLSGLSFAGIGFLDDYLKLMLKHSGGLKSRWKYLLQSLFALVVIAYLYVHHDIALHSFVVPFMGICGVSLVSVLVLAYFVIVGTSNAVNLTDGLDGLVIVPVMLVAAGLGVLAIIAGHGGSLYVPAVQGADELAVYVGALIGAGLGFLWVNAYPAQLFMGDVGALGLGASLGLMAIIIRQEIILFVMGGVFVIETLSVMIQVLYFKSTGGKRVFKMAPIHHHFELSGWPEPRVVIRFWIVTVVLVISGLMMILIR